MTELPDEPAADAAATADDPAVAAADAHPSGPTDVTVAGPAPAGVGEPTAGDGANPVPASAPAQDPPAPEVPPAGAAPLPELSPAACAARLAELFPALFGAGRALPIKLRIQADIQRRAPGVFTRKSLSPVLHRHTSSTAYLKALVNSPCRYDLDGAPAGEIDDEHRQAAAAELERRRAIVEARRAAERAAAAEARRREQAEGRQREAADEAARRDRAALLRAYESSTLTRANFCALKGIPEAELDERLHQAWLEREARAREARPTPGPGARDVPARADGRPAAPARADGPAPDGALSAPPSPAPPDAARRRRRRR